MDCISQMVEYQNGSALDRIFLGFQTCRGLIPTEKNRLLVRKTLDLFAGLFARHLGKMVINSLTHES